MKIWFGTTTAEWMIYREYYFAIRSYLLEIHCQLVFDWMERADKFYQTTFKDRNLKQIVAEITQAIDESDGVIIEYTTPNFSSSHQINYALSKKKPVLVMRLKKDNPRFNDSYLEAIQSPNLFIRDYIKGNYKQIIDEFLEFIEIEPGKHRYNIVLGEKEREYLDLASKQYKKSRSQIIRELINEKFKNNSN